VRYNEQTGVHELLSGSAPLSFFRKVSEKITEEMFSSELAERIQTALVDPSSEEISRMTLQKNYGAGCPMKQTVLMWDLLRYTSKVPQELLLVKMAIDAYIEEIAPTR
jgi:hypothetical protein